MKMVQRAHQALPLLSELSRYASKTYAAVSVPNVSQGLNGLTARDIKLVIDGGYNTVEAIAYT